MRPARPVMTDLADLIARLLRDPDADRYTGSDPLSHQPVLSGGSASVLGCLRRYARAHDRALPEHANAYALGRHYPLLADLLARRGVRLVVAPQSGGHLLSYTASLVPANRPVPTDLPLASDLPLTVDPEEAAAAEFYAARIAGALSDAVRAGDGQTALALADRLWVELRQLVRSHVSSP